MRRRTSAARSSDARGGFTFIEILVALAILAVIVSVMLQSQVRIAAARRQAEALQGAVIQMERFQGALRLGTTRDAILARTNALWQVQAEPVAVQGGENLSARWFAWTITPTNRTSLRSRFYLCE